MRPDLQRDIEEILQRHCDTALQQDTGPLFGVLATIARDLAHAEVSATQYEQATRAALTDCSPECPQKVVWRRIIRRVARDASSDLAAPTRENQIPRRHSSSAW
jgi:hypothetical protein